GGARQVSPRSSARASGPRSGPEHPPPLWPSLRDRTRAGPFTSLLRPHEGTRGDMRIGVPNQAPAGETRVALVPDVVARLKTRELEVLVESGAGERSHISDAAFEEAGARTGSSSDALGAEIVAVVRAPSAEAIGGLSRGAVLIGFLNPPTDAYPVRALPGAGASSFAMVAIPRI